MSEWIRERLVALIEEGRVSSQAEAARLLGVSPVQVNRVVLSYGLDLKYTRPPRTLLTCKTCSRRYHPTPRSRDGVCIPFQWAAKPREATIVCPNCGLSRTFAPHVIGHRKTALCKSCRARMPRSQFELEKQRIIAEASKIVT